MSPRLDSTASMNQVTGLSLIVVACLALSMGCTSGGSTSWQLAATTTRVQTDSLLHDQYAEHNALRRDLSAARITISRQEGEAAELVRKTALLEADRAELRNMLTQAHVAVNVLEHERDALKEALAQTQPVSLVRQSSSLPTTAEEPGIQEDIRKLKGSMIILSNTLEQLRDRFSSAVRATTSQPLHKSAAPPAKATSLESSPTNRPQLLRSSNGSTR